MDKQKKKLPIFIKYPLPFLIGAAAVILAALSFINLDHRYDQYLEGKSFLTEPMLSVVLTGIREGVYPLGSPFGADREAERSLSGGEFHIEEPLPGDDARERAAAAGDPISEHERLSRELEEWETPVMSFEWTEVDNDYFSDALFIGDSRTDGLARFSDLVPYTDFATRTALSIYDLFNWNLDFRSKGSDRTAMKLESILAAKQYKKIYFCIGINELGSGSTQSWAAEYKRALDIIRESQPGALIFIEAEMRITKGAETSWLKNSVVIERNEAVSAFADGQTSFYIDMNPAVCLEDGYLNPALTNDGVHLKATNYGLWTDFLRSHGISLRFEG